jgi:hypothetical protein
MSDAAEMIADDDDDGCEPLSTAAPAADKKRRPESTITKHFAKAPKHSNGTSAAAATTALAMTDAKGAEDRGDSTAGLTVAGLEETPKLKNAALQSTERLKTFLIRNPKFKTKTLFVNDKHNDLLWKWGRIVFWADAVPNEDRPKSGLSYLCFVCEKTFKYHSSNATQHLKSPVIASLASTTR